ncbi:MAG TPA: 50S ribosomal protein L25 [Candidatus Saccharimonadales bacterium]|nr:50S ribosomal protein L25 [Candidatus Saccharimonadales bacterium]
MAEAQKLEIRPRTVLGKHVGALRREGRLPGVIFGGHADSTPVDTDAHAFELAFRRWGTTTLLSLTGLESDVSALVNGVSRNPRTGKLIHVDFVRVSLTEKTHADVPLHFGGESPAVKTHGAVLVHGLEHVRVEAFPQDMPHRLEVDLSKIEQVDDTVHVRDLIFDTSKVVVLNDADEMIAKAVAARVEEEAPVVAEAAEGEAAEDEAAEAPAAGAAKGATPAKGAAPAKAAAGKSEGKG